MDSCITLDQVSLSYPTPRGSIEALTDMDLTVQSKEFVTIVGPTGCGKTSLLRLIGGLVAPTTGTIRVLGTTPAVARKQRAFSFVFQRPALLPWRSVFDNVALMGEIVGQTARLPADVLDLVGLRDYHALYPHQLSGGMQQRAALARALTIAPRVLLMDEPFGALDEITRENLNVELAQLCENMAVTAVLVTHSVAEAVFLSDSVITMSGRPGRAERRFQIPFDRPRTVSLLGSRAFIDLVRDIRMDLR